MKKTKIRHRQTCPKCKRKLVNIYKRGWKWRCHRCWKRKPWWRKLLRY